MHTCIDKNKIIDKKQLFIKIKAIGYFHFKNYSAVTELNTPAKQSPYSVYL